MRILYGKSIFKPRVVGIGIFDGVHKGHKRLLSMVKNLAREKGAIPCVLTFHPHPVDVLTAKHMPLILPLSRRIERIESLGLEVLTIEFTKAFANNNAEDFLKKASNVLGIRKFVAGADFVLGRDQIRAVDLPQWFHIVNLSTVSGEKISSSKIREAISKADLLNAKNMLGYWPRLWGKVVPGEGRAAKMGFPTANLELESDLLLPQGVFIVKVYLNKRSYWGLMSIGTKPTFYRKGKVWIEIYINKFSENLYNKSLELAVYKFVRPQRRFKSIASLRQAIQADVERLEEFIRGQSI